VREERQGATHVDDGAVEVAARWPDAREQVVVLVLPRPVLALEEWEVIGLDGRGARDEVHDRPRGVVWILDARRLGVRRAGHDEARLVNAVRMEADVALNLEEVAWLGLGGQGRFARALRVAVE
jgi:hypothetical protein